MKKAVLRVLMGDTMNIEECYQTLHGSYADALSRLANERLVRKFVLKFPADPTMSQLNEAVASGDVETSFRMAHTLKGVAANLAFTGLTEAASALTEQLRPCEQPADPDLLAAVQSEYDLVIDTLAKLES